MSGALLALAVALAACVQATAGMGFALVLSPVLLVALAPTTAIVLVTLLGLSLNVLVLLRRAGQPQVAWDEAVPIVLAAIPGSVCGLLVLRSLPKPGLEIGVGLVVVLLTLMRTLSPGVRVAARSENELGGRIAVGLVSGALSTASGVSGPPLALWLSGRRLAFTTIRDTLAACFLGMGVITALTLVPTFDEVHLRTLVVIGCFIAVVVGHALGGRLHARIGPERLQPLLSLIIFASGASAVIFGLTAL